MWDKLNPKYVESHISTYRQILLKLRIANPPFSFGSPAAVSPFETARRRPPVATHPCRLNDAPGITTCSGEVRSLPSLSNLDEFKIAKSGV
jgi:hypothetical protein